MSLSIKNRLYVLALIPLLVITIGMLSVTYVKTNDLNREQAEITRQNMMDIKKTELKQFLQLATSSVEPLLKQGAPLEDALPILKSLEYGETGYIFVYDSKGVRIAVGNNEKGIGESFWDFSGASSSSSLMATISPLIGA